MTPANLKHEFVYNGVTVKIYHALKNEGLAKHSHEYSHATMCNSGSIFVKKENIEFVMDKDAKPVNLKAGEWHEIVALEDDTVFVNVFAEGKN